MEKNTAAGLHSTELENSPPSLVHYGEPAGTKNLVQECSSEGTLVEETIENEQLRITTSISPSKSASLGATLTRSNSFLIKSPILPRRKRTSFTPTKIALPEAPVNPMSPKQNLDHMSKEEILKFWIGESLSSQPSNTALKKHRKFRKKKKQVETKASNSSEETATVISQNIEDCRVRGFCKRLLHSRVGKPFNWTEGKGLFKKSKKSKDSLGQPYESVDGLCLGSHAPETGGSSKACPTAERDNVKYLSENPLSHKSGDMAADCGQNNEGDSLISWSYPLRSSQLKKFNGSRIKSDRHRNTEKTEIGTRGNDSVQNNCLTRPSKRDCLHARKSLFFSDTQIVLTKCPLGVDECESLSEQSYCTAQSSTLSRLSDTSFLSSEDHAKETDRISEGSFVSSKSNLGAKEGGRSSKNPHLPLNCKSSRRCSSANDGQHRFLEMNHFMTKLQTDISLSNDSFFINCYPQQDSKTPTPGQMSNLFNGSDTASCHSLALPLTNATTLHPLFNKRKSLPFAVDVNADSEGITSRSKCVPLYDVNVGKNSTETLLISDGDNSFQEDSITWKYSPKNKSSTNLSLDNAEALNDFKTHATQHNFPRSEQLKEMGLPRGPVGDVTRLFSLATSKQGNQDEVILLKRTDMPTDVFTEVGNDAGHCAADIPENEGDAPFENQSLHGKQHDGDTGRDSHLRRLSHENQQSHYFNTQTPTDKRQELERLECMICKTAAVCEIDLSEKRRSRLREPTDLISFDSDASSLGSKSNVNSEKATDSGRFGNERLNTYENGLSSNSHCNALAETQLLPAVDEVTTEPSGFQNSKAAVEHDSRDLHQFDAKVPVSDANMASQIPGETNFHQEYLSCEAVPSVPNKSSFTDISKEDVFCIGNFNLRTWFKEKLGFGYENVDGYKDKFACPTSEQVASITERSTITSISNARYGATKDYGAEPECQFSNFLNQNSDPTDDAVFRCDFVPELIAAPEYAPQINKDVSTRQSTFFCDFAPKRGSILDCTESVSSHPTTFHCDFMIEQQPTPERSLESSFENVSSRRSSNCYENIYVENARTYEDRADLARLKPFASYESGSPRRATKWEVAPSCCPRRSGDLGNKDSSLRSPDSPKPISNDECEADYGDVYDLSLTESMCIVDAEDDLTSGADVTRSRKGMSSRRWSRIRLRRKVKNAKCFLTCCYNRSRYEH